MERLTSQLSGTRSPRPRRSYFIPIHRFLPKPNEHDAACLLQRKLGQGPALQPSAPSAIIDADRWDEVVFRQHRRYSICPMSLGICTQECMRSS
jgi:hypothetical protein